MQACKNPHCPVEYNPNKEPCKSCKFNVAKDLNDDDAVKFFTDLFGMK